MLRLLVFTFCSFWAVLSQAAVWTEVNQWSQAYEDRFAEWVRTDWNTSFFSRKYLQNGQSNPYYRLRVDCADTVYSMRIIFAYENRLPFVAQDPTASGRTISNKMSRWDGQSEQQRVRNFLLFIYDTMSTRSLPNDTYPVAINRNTVRAGGLIATTKKNHHSWTIKEMLPIGVPHLVYNSVVGAFSGYGLKERQSWPNPSWVFEGDYSAQSGAGLRYWRPTSALNKPVWQTPGYSDEQFKIPLGKWQRYVQTRLALRQETDEQLMTRLLGATCEGLTSRVPAINEGIQYLQKNSKCMKYETYDTYSTPSRDRRVFDDFVALRRSYREILDINQGQELSPTTKAQLNKIFPAITLSARAETQSMPAQQITPDSLCVVEYLPGRKMDLSEFKRRIYAGLISNNPHDGGEYRWGDLRGPSQRARKCKSWDPWSPDLNQE